MKEKSDPVNHPAHYKKHPSGIECIQITEHMNFNLGNAVKYIWRADLKKNALEDLKKAAWYLDREIQKRTKGYDPKQETNILLDSFVQGKEVSKEEVVNSLSKIYQKRENK